MLNLACLIIRLRSRVCQLSVSTRVVGLVVNRLYRSILLVWEKTHRV